MSKESVAKTAQAIPAIKILPPQITKLMKEEDEETWISGEELYTEGSSDEENCRCKFQSPDISKVSLTLSKPHRFKGKVDKKPKNIHSRAAPAKDKDSLVVQSTSKEHHSPKTSGTDEEEAYTADDEISWKANRDELLLEDEIMALQEHERKYPQICESMDKIFEDFVEKLNCLEDIQSENFTRQNERLKNDLKNSVGFFNTALNKLHKEIECIKQKTQQFQLQNRSRLKEIVLQGPPESKKLARNTKKFLELHNKNKSTYLADKTESTNLLKVSSVPEEDITNNNFTSTKSNL